MPFGLCNAPATFQRLVDVVLAGLLWDICLVYMDDIIVFGKTLEEHFDNIERVFAAVVAAGITLQPSKCKFCQTKLPFQVVRNGCILLRTIHGAPAKLQIAVDIGFCPQ